MPLVKLEVVDIVEGSQGVEGHAASTYCVPAPAGPADGGLPTPGPGVPPPVTPPPTSSGQEVGVRVYLYTADGQNRTPSTLPAPAGYTCTTGQFFNVVREGDFGIYTPVYETRCYAGT